VLKEAEERIYLSTAEADSRTPQQWAQLIRGHWGGIENRNHWRKDACLLEDKTTCKQPGVVGAFGLLRNILLFFYAEQDVHPTINGYVESTAANPSKAYSMLKAKL
jgi:hypothetical protein